MSEMQKLLESLNPDERAVLPFLEQGKLTEAVLQSGLDETKVLRALQFLGNKGILKLESKKEKIVDLGKNGIVYLKNGLPERRLLNIVASNKTIHLQDAKSEANLSENEFKAALGALRRKALIDMSRGNILLNAKPEEITKKSLEEQLIEVLPMKFDSLAPEQKLALQNLKSRRDIIEIKEEKQTTIILTDLGKEIISKDLKKIGGMIEAVTPELIKSGNWKGKKFRRYDIKSPVPQIYGGKRHFVNQAIDYAKKIWTDLGFEEMTGNFTQTGFWNFDALFTAQDNPVREIQDTFYINNIKGKLPKNKKLVQQVKQSHESGVGGSKGWQYQWNEEIPKKVILRTHTTCLSASTLAKLREAKEKKGKFFAIGRNFRNETVDWSHGFEFNQTEGIVIDKDANFRQLLGYLKEFYKKMGFEKVRFSPGFFPYTEPSVETNVWNPERKVWLEMGGAGMFRPELTIPLLGEHIPVLAWGQGFDRNIMNYYEIKDLREMYKNNIDQLRKMKFWLK